MKARGAAAAKSSESPQSRAVHNRLFMAAILLFFLSVPGLNGQVLPSGRWTVIAGAAMISNCWHALIGFAVMSFAYWRKIRMEERWLLDAFGGGYVEYRRGT